MGTVTLFKDINNLFIYLFIHLFIYFYYSFIYLFTYNDNNVKRFLILYFNINC